MNDELGNRMKEQYENRTRYLLPRRTYSILRLDGKAFHTYTKGLNKPFDRGLSNDIDNAIIAMLGEIQGVVFAYTQSDEISVLLTDFEKESTSAWFDGNLQKMTSVAASIITGEFNKLRFLRNESNWLSNKPSVFPSDFVPAYFDCRVFTIPDRTEVMNYFRWRQQDCIRNSVSMVAQSNFTHNELQGKSQRDMHDMLHAKGINWATDYTDGEKNGRVIMKETFNEKFAVAGTTELFVSERTRWVARGAWVFTKDEGKLLNMIPKYED